jgi:Mor family transcriptional regulator
VPKKLNDTQIAEIVFKHTNGTSISALAKEYEISRDTVRRYLSSNAEMRQNCDAIKNETVTEWIKANSSRIQGILDLCIDLLPKKLKEASTRDIVGAIKVLTETTVNNEGKEKTNEKDALDRLCDAIQGAVKDE